MPNPWVIIGVLVSFIAVAVGGFFYGEHVERLGYEAAIAKQERDVAELKASHDAKIAAINTQVEHDNAVQQSALDAANSRLRDAADELDRLRNARCGGGGVNNVRRPAGAAKPAPGDAGATPGSFRELDGIIQSCVAVARYAASAHSWASQVSKVGE